LANTDKHVGLLLLVSNRSQGNDSASTTSSTPEHMYRRIVESIPAFQHGLRHAAVIKFFEEKVQGQTRALDELTELVVLPQAYLTAAQLNAFKEAGENTIRVIHLAGPSGVGNFNQQQIIPSFACACSCACSSSCFCSICVCS
jgi:hypothetical protein